jgi:hypothetical protein
MQATFSRVSHPSVSDTGASARWWASPFSIVEATAI